VNFALIEVFWPPGRLLKKQLLIIEGVLNHEAIYTIYGFNVVHTTGCGSGDVGRGSGKRPVI
jgi:hypothetical protein